MNSKRQDALLCIVFCVALAGMALGYLLPGQDYSALEKRYLEDRPSLSWETLSSGEFSEAAERYLADHILGRSFLVGVNAYYERLTLRQADKEIYEAEDGRLVEAPIQWDEAAANKNMKAVNEFASQMGGTVYFSLIPSSGWAAQEGIRQLARPYRDEELIERLYAMADPDVQVVSLTEAFAGNADWYFKTDHHWNSQGAYQGSVILLRQFGKEQAPESAFKKINGGDFRGTTYSRSGLWLKPAEEIVFWQSSAPLTVTNEESDVPHEGALYWENLDQDDPYTVNLDGNHAVVRISNPQGTGKLLVVRDSFSNSMGAFLAESYEEVILVDLRYYKGAVSELAEGEDTDVLICYSLYNFLNDANLIWLR